MKSIAEKAALAAGKLLMKNYKKSLNIDVKNKKSLVSNIDLESEKLILKMLQEKFPDHNYITEESEKIDNGSEYTWHIDPVDGTHNYIRGIPIFGVSIALEHNGEIVSGTINLPYLNKIYTAVKGKGAFCNNKKINVSDKETMDFSILVFDFGHSVRAKSTRMIKKIGDNVNDIRNWGCAVFALTQLAEGNMEGYVVHKTNSWDVTAGFLLIEEAGGVVTNHKNKPWSIDETSFLASNGNLHNKLLELL